MNNVPNRETIHQYLYLFALALLVCCLPLSKYLLSISQFLLLLNWLAEGKFREKVRSLRKNPAILVFGSMLLLYLAGMLYTTHADTGWSRVKNALPLMALPMIILYEICIWLAYFDRKKNRIKEEQEARESMERQLAREEKLRAEAASQPPPEDNGWHDDEYPPKDYHADDKGDDGWHDDYHQQDHHATDEIPQIEESLPVIDPESPSPKDPKSDS